MQATYTKHAAQRLQQRGIPPAISDWLLVYGDEVFDGRGGIFRYFSSRSLRTLEREVGKEPIKRVSEYLRCYLIESSSDGAVITVGKRYPGNHVWRH